jgi:hypothetical protein
LAGILLGVAGCRKESAVEADLGTTEPTAEWSSHDFAFAVDNLQRLEQFSGGEMRQQVIDRLNQWVQHEKRPADWKVDPLVAGLPKPLAETPEMRSLDELPFSPQDGYAMQEAIWMRDVSKWTRGDATGRLARAENIFDWVVRNIQLEPGTGREPERLAQRPWETLLWGKGTALDRAWVFILLLRQQGIDAVILGLPEKDAKDADDANRASGQSLEPWAVGVLVDKDLYLFDPALGLPIPGPEGAKYGDGRLAIRPATLAQVVADPGLLKALSLPEHPYPVDAARLGGVVALVEASPAYLAARMRLVESRLAGDQEVVLTTSPSATAARLKDVAHLADRRLWSWPFELSARRSQMTDAQRKEYGLAMMPFQVRRDTPLWKGRVLHLKGRFTEERGAMAYYLTARVSTRVLAGLKRQVADVTDPKEAARMRAQLDAQIRGKGDATYWIGLVEVAEGRPAVAADYFQIGSLIRPWAQGARYNLGRVAESLGKPKEAAVIYRTAGPSADTHGNLLRAKWLEPATAEVSLPGAGEP